MVIKSFFDHHPCGVPVYSYELKGRGSVSVKVIDFGARLLSIYVPDENDVIRDVIGGFDRVIDYMDSGEYQGATVGRVCNRLKNAKYTIDGVEYSTFANEGNNVCHAGRFGWDSKIWSVADINDSDEPSITFTYNSYDGDEGFPGNVKVNATYTLVGDSLKLDYEATTDKKTIINMTNHAYFNMNGYDNGTVENHIIRMNSDKFNETDIELIPTGNLTDVADTPFDMRKPIRLDKVLFGDHDKIRELGGLDTNFIMNDHDGTVKHQADFYSPQTKIGMKIYTDQTSILIYSSNKIKPTEPNMKRGVKQITHFGACFEASSMPDSINHANFDDTTLSPGEVYRRTTMFEFTRGIDLI